MLDYVQITLRPFMRQGLWLGFLIFSYFSLVSNRNLKLVKRGNGLIVNMSSPGGLTYLFNTAYGVGKAAQDRMAQDFNHELRGTGVYALAVWPGAVKTELIQVSFEN